MRPPRLTTLTVAALATCVAAVTLAGCSKSHDQASPSSSAGASTAATAASPVTQDTLPAASAIVNDVAKRKSVVITKCAAATGGWSASGTANNTGTADATYAITIFFTNAHSTVEDYATTSVTVKAGQTQNWSTTKQFAATTPTNCVLRGVG
jgi:hypothetical protein